jgi:Flp pilus assembly protein TadG
VIGAFWLGIAAICLMAIDIGHVFWQQREVQRIADMAALAGAASNDEATCYANMPANATLNGLKAPVDAVVEPKCGHWSKLVDTSTGAVQDADAEHPFNAARVTITRQVPYFFVFSFTGPSAASRTVMARATAARSLPLAALNIRSTLASVDSSKSPLLNAVFGGLLGGSLNLSAAGWDGLAKANINLLSYLDQLAVDLGVAAGQYDQLLATSTSVQALLQAAIEVMQRDGGTGSVSLDAAAGLLALQAATPFTAPPVKLGELLQVQSGTPAAGLDTGLQALQLAQGIVQLANSKSAAVADIQSSLLGLASASVHLKVIEPPQISAIGNPELAKADPYGPNKIFVRTAQMRTLISVELPVLSAVAGLAKAITDALSPVTNMLNSLLALDLNALGCALTPCDTTYIRVLPPPLRLDINLDVGNGNARVKDFSCAAEGKSLTTLTTTSASDLRVGSMGSSAEDAKSKVFSSAALPAVATVPVVDIGSWKCTLLGCNEATRKPFYGGGLGLIAQVPVATSTQDQVFQPAPNLDEPPVYQAISTQSIVSSLTDTLHGLDVIQPIPPTASEGAGPGAVLTGLTSALSGVITVLTGVVSGLLSPLLDPLLNTLLPSLGIDLAKTEVAGRLNCEGGVDLVY